MNLNKKKKKKKYIILGVLVFVMLMVVAVFLVLHFVVFKVASPLELVDNFINDYNTLSESVVSKITYEFDDKLSKKQSNKYTKIMKKQYQKMFYSVLDEQVDDKKAVIKIEVTVSDFNNCYNEAVNHIAIHSEKFSTVERQIDYKLNKLDTCSEKVTYPITLNFRKAGKEWLMDEIDENDLKKIQGLY